MEISINEKSVLELNQPQIFHREDFVCIKIHDTIEHIYIYIKKINLRSLLLLD